MVIVKRMASRFQRRLRNSTTDTVVAIVRNMVEPRNEMPRIEEVITGDANWCTASRVMVSKRCVSPSRTSSASHAKKTSAPIEVPSPTTSDKLKNSSRVFLERRFGFKRTYFGAAALCT